MTNHVSITDTELAAMKKQAKAIYGLVITINDDVPRLIAEVKELRAALRRMIVAAYGDLPRKELDAEIAKARAALGEK